MMRCRFLVASCIGTLFYVAVSFVGGRDGLWASDQMQKQKRLLSANAAEIEKMNEELSLEKVALQKDMDVIAAYARRLGYIEEGEKLVKISGLSTHETQIYDAGNVLKHQEPQFVPEWLCKGMGLVAFLSVYFVMLLADMGHGIARLPLRKKLFDKLKQMPLYDIQ